MRRMRTPQGLVLACLMTMLVACTPGAQSPPGGSQALVPGAVVIQVSLIKYQPQQTKYGTVAGYDNDDLTVHVGAVVQFHNQDGFTHTASSVGTNGFPSGSPLTDKARTQAGSDLAQADWSSGDLGPDAYSQPFKASTPGTYFYGCFFHYNTPMRGVITVQ
jgi:plastocyanin